MAWALKKEEKRYREPKRRASKLDHPISFSIHTAQDLQRRSSGANEGQEEIDFIADDKPPWVDPVGQGQTGGHFPGIHKSHTEVSKGSSEKPVHLQGEPVTSIHGLVAGVGQLDDHESAGLPGQQCSHRCPDPCESLHKDRWGKGGEVGTQAQHHRCVGAPGQASQLPDHRVQGGHRGAQGAQGPAVGPPVQHYAPSGLHCHQGPRLIRGVQIHRLQGCGEDKREA